MKVTLPILVAALSVLSFGVTGCSILKPQADLTQFYVLRPQSGKVPVRSVPAIEIRVGPGQLAGYLENSQIAVQGGPHRVDYLDLYRWAEPPSMGISRVLSENLAASLNGAHLIRYPDPGLADAGLEVRYEVERFEGILAGPVSLEVSWQVVRRPSGEGIAGQRSVYTVPVQGKTEDIASYVERLSTAIALWADDIAAAIPSP